MLIKLNILKFMNKLVILTILFLLFSCHNSSDISFKNFDIVNLAESSYADEFIVLDELKKCLNLLDGIKAESVSN